MSRRVAIVGGGPAGLFSALQLVEKGISVDLYEQKSGVGKKFLVAGHGGLNLTHSEPLDTFSKRYGLHSHRLMKMLKGFGPSDLREWCAGLGVETFIGTSGRVFPTTFKAADILLRLVDKLKSSDLFHLHLKHRFVQMDAHRILTFATDEGEKQVTADNIIFALGGASWSQTGSDGKWVESFSRMGLKLVPFLPMNCGFQCQWSSFFKDKLKNHVPLKNIELFINGESKKGEVMLTPYGMEGGAVYALSREIRDQILENGHALVHLDLKPAMKEEDLVVIIKGRKAKTSWSSFFQNKLKLNKLSYTLFKELNPHCDFSSEKIIAQSIKKLEIRFDSCRPIEEAISTSGGVAFENLTDDLEMREFPGCFVIGEMLDYDAPTGGYLLQGCFSTAWRVVESIAGQ